MYAGHNSDVEAHITFLRTEEGGREKPVRTGYRPQFFYQGEDHDAIHECESRVEQKSPTANCQFTIAMNEQSLGRTNSTRLL